MDGKIDGEIARRLGMAHQDLHALMKVWKHSNLDSAQKLSRLPNESELQLSSTVVNWQRVGRPRTSWDTEVFRHATRIVDGDDNLAG
eukprot:2752919-Karenia_brevis.AAC.1